MKKYKGRACYIKGIKELALEYLETHSSDKNALIKVTRGGICGSDIHYYFHGGIGDLSLQHPMILGHEVVGEVIETPLNSTLKIGQKVALNPSLSCGHCHYCLEGDNNHCSDIYFWGSAMRTPHVHGGFTDYLSIHPTRCIPYHHSVPEKVMVFAEPLSVAIHSINLAGSLISKHILISGAGPIGCLIVAAAKASGAESITVFDISDKSCQLALKMGADNVVNPVNSKQIEFFKDNKGYFDVSFDASGAESAIQLIFQVTKPKGTIIQVGNSRGLTAIPLMELVAKELVLKGSFRFTNEFICAVSWLENKRVDPLPLISAELPICDAEQAILLAADKTKSAKVQLIFD
ncbi:zinc-binding dehydrogenase [Providencia rettgeri]|uniref:zinc-binding dehydrogenase n=1 Tax=Providencia rettgeri TaxID=587 RepID=UPI000F76B74E|nr:alcohol dehydrogenase catalytic domain-containing protein [Providencia rettgeri]MBV2189991.1 alcohol dehydrogenase catalytic domain-containing protein [Providencia rettgeri]